MINVAVLGCGGLGQKMALLIDQKRDFKLVGICDKNSYVFNPNGISGVEVVEAGSVENIKGSEKSGDPISDLVSDFHDNVDAIFIALPNLPNEFIPNIARNIALLDFKGVVIDALKRTQAVDMIKALDEDFKNAGILYLTGCGATPGLLTTAAALAAQSFVEVLNVEITFGVGISNWEQYKSTIREDIAHLKGFSPEIVAKMTDKEVEAELNKRNGILELKLMEHADDLMLELANVCPRDRVKVGGVVDTRNAKKPLSTNVKITGRTFEGEISTHQFTLGDETSMACNVNGPVLGFMSSGLWLYDLGVRGTLTSADVMPRFSQPVSNYQDIIKTQKAIKVKTPVTA